MSSHSGWLPDHLVMDEIITKLPISTLIKLRYEVSEPYSDIIYRFILRSLFGADDDDDDADALSGVLVKVQDKTTILNNHNDHLCHWFYLSSDDDGKLQLRFSMTPEYSYDPSHFVDTYPMVHHCGNTFLGSLNGVVALTEGDSIARRFWMWDPSADSYEETVPPCITPHPYPNYRAFPCFDCFEVYEYFGCGYCAHSKDLKVVCVRGFAYYLFHGYSTPSEPWESESDESEEFSDANDAFSDTGDGFLDARDDTMDSHSDFEVNDDMEEPSPILVRDLNLQPDCIVEVYSLSTNSWRRVVVDPQTFSEFPPYGTRFTPQIGYTNNTFSWMVSCCDGNGGVIVKLLTFNMTTEVFQVTSLPDAIFGGSYDYSIPPYVVQDGQGRSPIQLSNGIVALVIPNRDQSFDSFDIWLLLEYGVADSWTRLCTVGPFSEVRKILGFWKNGKVFMESNSGELVLADLVTNKIIQSLHIEGCPGVSQIIPY